VDVPTGKVEPLAGAHAIVTGGAPPVDVAVPYWTWIGWLLGDVNAAGGVGQAIFGPLGKGSVGVGCVGLLHAGASDKRSVMMTGA
jgi:hypothetical protein